MLSLAPRLASAQRAMPSRVRVESTPCAVGPFDARAWGPLLRNELETDGVETVDVNPTTPDTTAPLAVIRVEFARCDETSTEAAVTIDDELTDKTVRRVVALDDIAAEGRARALALAIAELLRASWIELAIERSQAAEAPAPQAIRRAMLLRVRPRGESAERGAQPPAQPAARPEARRLWIGAGVDLRTFPGQSGALLGGRVVFDWRPWERGPLRLRADAGWAAGTALATRGEIEMNLVSAGVGVMFGGGDDRIDLAVGARLEGGWAWVSGTAATAAAVGADGSDAVLLATVTATLRVALSARWSAALDVSAGQTLRYVTVSAGEERVAGLRGPALSVGLGVGASLP